MKILLLILIAVYIQASDIRVALAANVSYAIDDLLKEFYKTHPDIKVKVTIGGSGNLTSQIRNGAPYDLFMSANMKYPNSLYLDKKTVNKPVVYAKGSLALLSVKKRDFKSGLEILKNKDIKKIAVANPKTAPYGKAAFEALKNAKLLEELKPKFVFGQSISQTVAFTIKAADIGIIAKSALFNPKLSNFKEDENWIEVDSKLYTPIKQGIVMIRDSKSAKAFYDFILSKSAKEIFKKYGYIVE
jgi:molybdate transport system substrate-binding protein